MRHTCSGGWEGPGSSRGALWAEGCEGGSGPGIAPSRPPQLTLLCLIGLRLLQRRQDPICQERVSEATAHEGPVSCVGTDGCCGCPPRPQGRPLGAGLWVMGLSRGRTSRCSDFRQWLGTGLRELCVSGLSAAGGHCGEAQGTGRQRALALFSPTAQNSLHSILDTFLPSQRLLGIWNVHDLQVTRGFCSSP